MRSYIEPQLKMIIKRKMKYALFQEFTINFSKFGFELTLYVENEYAPGHLFNGICIRFMVFSLKFGVNSYTL